MTPQEIDTLLDGFERDLKVILDLLLELSDNYATSLDQAFDEMNTKQQARLAALAAGFTAALDSAESPGKKVQW